MKKKFLAGLILISAISANSFAMEIPNGKLIKHREWTTGNIKSASFKQTKMKQAFDFKRLQSNDNRSSFALMKNNRLGAFTRSDGATYLYSDNDIGLYNFSQNQQTFDVKISMCTQDSENYSFNCYDTSDTISLEKNSRLDYRMSPIITLTLKPGHYTAVVGINITNVSDTTSYGTYAVDEFNVDEDGKA